MRARVLAGLLLALPALAGCSAFLDFGDFTVAEDAGTVDAASDAGPQDGLAPDACGPCATGYDCRTGQCGETIVEIQSMRATTCVLLAAGQVWCWGGTEPGGTNPDAELGRGASVVPAHVAARVVSSAAVPLSGVTDLAVGMVHACAVVQGDTLCWGSNASGQLPLTIELTFNTALAVGRPGAAVGTNTHETCVVDGAGASCVVSTTMWRPISGIARDATLRSGDNHVCALASGEVLCWGDVVPGTWRTSPPPVSLTDSVDPVAQVTSGHTHLCVRTTANAVYCVGENRKGEVGVGVGRMGPVPELTAIATPAGSPVWTDVATGLDHSCAVTTTGDLYCWGKMEALGDPGTAYPVPTQLTMDVPPNIRLVAAGETHTCVVTAGNDVFCLGDNAEGQLGADPASTAMSAMPIQVTGLP